MTDIVKASLALACATNTVDILGALEVIDRSAAGICCIVDENGKLEAVITDGDVRRALISGAKLDQAAIEVAQTRPRTAPLGATRASVLDVMTSLRISAVPEIDSDGRLVSLHTLSDIIGGAALPNSAVIMAGGRGTRLGDLTKNTPKPLMTVAGRPIIEWVILGLVGDGVTHIFVTVNHMADQIMDRLGDGSSLGCRIEYIQESPELPLGTAGSLTLLPEDVISSNQPPLIVLNSDVMVDFDARALLQSHASGRAKMTLGTKLYQHTVPFGVVEIGEGRRISGIVEKPELAVEVNAAVYCVDADLISRLPHGQPSTMPELTEICLKAGEIVNAWPLASEWIDVGTPADLARAKGES